MATPQLIPMFAPDGTLGDIPADRVQDAVKAGGKLGINFIAPDGSRGVIPVDRIGEALKAGGMPEHAMMPRRPMQKSYGVSDFLNDIATVGGDLNQVVKGIPRALATGMQMTDPMTALNDRSGMVPLPDQALEAARQQTAREQKAGYSKSYQTAAAVASAIGANVPAMEDAAARGDVKGVALHTIAPAILGIGQARGFGDVGPEINGADIVNQVAGREIMPKASAPITDAVAAQRITDAANPAPKQMSKFQSNLEQQLPNIRQFVTKKPETLSDVLDGVRQAAEAKKNDYYQNIIQPNADVNLPAPSLYRGQLVQGGPARTQVLGEPLPTDATYAPTTSSATTNIPRSATIGMLDQRLSEINNILSGGYDKEGIAQQTALAQPDKVALRAEAAQIRDLLNNDLGVRTGMGKDAVAQARADMGQLRDLQRKLDLAVNLQRFRQNQQGPAWKGAVSGAVAGGLTGHPVAAAGGAAAGLAAELTGRAVARAALKRAIMSAF